MNVQYCVSIIAFFSIVLTGCSTSKIMGWQKANGCAPKNAIKTHKDGATICVHENSEGQRFVGYIDDCGCTFINAKEIQWVEDYEVIQGNEQYEWVTSTNCDDVSNQVFASMGTLLPLHGETPVSLCRVSQNNQFYAGAVNPKNCMCEVMIEQETKEFKNYQVLTIPEFTQFVPKKDTLLGVVYDEVQNLYRNEDVHIVRNGLMYGLINSKEEKVIFPCEYYFPRIYYDGGPLFGRPNVARKGDQWGTIDVNGKTGIAFKYDYLIETVIGDYEYVGQRDGQVYSIDSDGNEKKSHNSNYLWGSNSRGAVLVSNTNTVDSIYLINLSTNEPYSLKNHEVGKKVRIQKDNLFGVYSLGKGMIIEPKYAHINLRFDRVLLYENDRIFNMPLEQN